MSGAAPSSRSQRADSFSDSDDEGAPKGPYVSKYAGLLRRPRTPPSEDGGSEPAAAAAATTTAAPVPASAPGSTSQLLRNGLSPSTRLSGARLLGLRPLSASAPDGRPMSARTAAAAAAAAAAASASGASIGSDSGRATATAAGPPSRQGGASSAALRSTAKVVSEADSSRIGGIRGGGGGGRNDDDDVDDYDEDDGDDGDVGDFLEEIGGETDAEGAGAGASAAATATGGASTIGSGEEGANFFEVEQEWANLQTLRLVFESAGLDRAQQTRFLQALRPERFAPGDCIVRQGEVGDKLFVITEGEVKGRAKRPQLSQQSSHFGGAARAAA